VISTNALDVVKVVERARILGLSAVRLGSVGGDRLTIKTAVGDFGWPVGELYDLWWNSIARAMK